MLNSGQRFEIVIPADAAISAVGCNPQTHATFKRLFERSELEPFAKEVLLYADYCVLFKNDSPRHITALTLVWEYPHPTLQGPPGNVSRSDAYYFGRHPEGVIPARSEALIYPKWTIPAAALEHESFVFGSFETRRKGLSDLDMMREAPRVAVTFDAVIFEDGRVLGHDEVGTAEFITLRKKAANDFVILIRRAKQDFESIENVLEKLLARETGNSRDDPYGFWLRTFAAQLRKSPDPDISLTQYADLPQLPTFILDSGPTSE
jgi:hypothetical protein